MSAGACAAVIAMAGCGGKHVHTATVSAHAAGAAPNASSHARGSGSATKQPATRPIVTLPKLGSLSYRCGRRGRVEATLSARSADATETATVERDNGRHLRAVTLAEPGHFQLKVPFARYRSLIWRMIQSTEPETLEATVRLYFHRSDTNFGCLARWSSTVDVIGHGGSWSLPPAWP